jgi:uncharacterized protein YbjT (DUF2867 family)
MPTKKRSQTILVTGATGQQGGATLRHLRKAGFPVRALTRHPDEPQARALAGQVVELAQGDMDDRISLTRALDDAYGVFSVQNSHTAGIEGEIRQGIQLADLARTSNIEQFVYSSVGSADQRTGIPHFDSKFRIEEHIRATGMHYTIVRPVFFMENWLGMRQTIEAGTLSLPLSPTTRLQMIATDNIGGAVAAAFEHPKKWQNRVVELAGDELSMTELAAVFSTVSGREVRYVQAPWDEFEKQAGKEMTLMYRWFEEVGYHVDISATRLEHPDLLTFDHWMNLHWNAASEPRTSVSGSGH